MERNCSNCSTLIDNQDITVVETEVAISNGEHQGTQSDTIYFCEKCSIEVLKQIEQFINF